MTFHTPTRPPRISRVRGPSLFPDEDRESDMKTLPNSLQIALLRIREVELPQLVERALAPYKLQVNTLTQTVANLQVENKKLQEQVDRIEKNELEEVKISVQKLETYSRRGNLKFLDIEERQYETKFDCKRTILQVLQDSNINIPPKAIESAHRIGPKLHRQPRPIIVKLFHAEEKELIFAKAHHIWMCTRIRIEEDFTAKITANRKILRPILTAANHSKDKYGNREFNANLRLDKLNVNGKSYTVNNLDKLPEKLNPEKLATPTKGNITAFFSRNSPFSNHYPAIQKVGKTEYNCNEQYYMAQKALAFNDHATVAAIMREQDPGRQKALGKGIRIKNFDQRVWDERCIKIMSTGLKAKFTQNARLKEYLLSTGTNMLLECNPKDYFWGVGLSLQNRKIWEANSWLETATNHLGRLLHELRRELRNNQD